MEICSSKVFERLKFGKSMSTCQIFLAPKFPPYMVCKCRLQFCVFIIVTASVKTRHNRISQTFKNIKHRIQWVNN